VCHRGEDEYTGKIGSYGNKSVLQTLKSAHATQQDEAGWRGGNAVKKILNNRFLLHPLQFIIHYH
jgi:hypothetical protein